MTARSPGSGLLAAGLLALIIPAYAAEGEGQEFSSYSLKHKAHKKWDFILPAEKWLGVRGGEIDLGEAVFAAEQAGVMKLSVDTNGDGKLDKDVKGQSGFLNLRAKTEEGEKFDYSIRLRNRSKKYEWTTAGTMSGNVAGKQVHLIDQDGNGCYDDFGVDAMTVGKDRAATLLSSVVLLGDTLYEIEVEQDGSEIRAKPWQGETAKVNVLDEFDAKGKLVSAIFRCGDYSFNFASDKKGINVPAGEYEFVFGKVEAGSDSVLMQRGKMKRIALETGQEKTIEWGGPIEGTFSFSKTSTKVTVKADLKYFGSGGEEYHTFMPRGKPPTIFVKDSGGKLIKKARFAES